MLIKVLNWSNETCVGWLTATKMTSRLIILINSLRLLKQERSQTFCCLQYVQYKNLLLFLFQIIEMVKQTSTFNMSI